MCMIGEYKEANGITPVWELKMSINFSEGSCIGAFDS